MINGELAVRYVLWHCIGYQICNVTDILFKERRDKTKILDTWDIIEYEIQNVRYDWRDDVIYYIIDTKYGWQ